LSNLVFLLTSLVDEGEQKLRGYEVKLSNQTQTRTE